MTGTLLLLRPALGRAQHRPAAPFFLTLHLAGGTGLVAVGGGVRVARERLEPEVLVGYLPRRLSGTKALAIFTLKATYLPWKTELGHSRWQAQPLTLGARVSYTTGQQFFLTGAGSGRYRPGYYWWSSAVRLGLLAGSRLSYRPAGGPRTSLYSELSTNDLHLVSALTNHTLRLPEILTLGGGVKVGAREK